MFRNLGHRKMHGSFFVKDLNKSRDGHVDVRFQMTFKIVALTLVAFVAFTLVVKRDPRAGHGAILISDADFERLVAQNFQEPNWMLPVAKQGGDSYEVQNVTLGEIVAYLEKISDCQKMSEIHRVLYSNDPDAGEGVLRYLNSGWTKTVYSFQAGGAKPVAVKVLNPSGEDVLNCVDGFKQKVLGSSSTDKNRVQEEERPYSLLNDLFKMADSEEQTTSSTRREERLLEMCRNKAKLKLMKEAYLMNVFKNENVVKLRDICLFWENDKDSNSKDGSNYVIPRSRKSGGDDVMTFSKLSGLRVTYSTQYGGEADLISLLQLSWEDRLRVCYGISKLLKYFSMLNDVSVSINDFRRQQFVLVDGDIMMTDLDDLTFEERSCRFDRDCHLGDDELRSSAVKCSGGKCYRWHDARNTKNAGTHFVSVLLPYGVPEYLKPLASEIINNFTSATWRTEENHGLVEKLVKEFAGGMYLARVREGRVKEEKIGRYEVMEGHDQPGQHDYRCRYTRGAYGCTVSVHDEGEAKALCDADESCRGFVLSPLKSWTGRRYAHLKSNVTRGALKKAPKGYALYYKPEL